MPSTFNGGEIQIFIASNTLVGRGTWYLREIISLNTFFYLTLYTGREILVLRHSVLHFPSNSGDIAS